MIFDPNFIEIGLRVRVYTMLNYGTYLLLVSSLLNNCSTTYIVNSKDLFELGSIRKVLLKDRIKTRITSTSIAHLAVKVRWQNGVGTDAFR
jgi:hypothetical protein